MEIETKMKINKAFFSLQILLLIVLPNKLSSQGIVLNEISSSNYSLIQDEDGDYEDWIELYNSGSQPINLNGYGLTDDSTNLLRWVFPDITIQVGEYRLIWASGKDRRPADGDGLSELHANFSIKSTGEETILSDTNGIRVDDMPAIEIPADLSYGRLPDGNDEYVLFQTPTPASENLDILYIGPCEEPEFSITEGFYTGSAVVSLSSATPGSSIYYSLDSSEPTEESIPFTGDISISKTSILRARAYSQDFLPSLIATKTYFIDEDFSFPVVSLTTDPYNLYDIDSGIFVYTNPYWESNLFQDWERPVNIQFFETDQNLGFNIDAGMKVHGGLTRGVAQKSIAVMTKSMFGDSKINYKFFEDKDISTFNNIVFRNSGNDFNRTLFRDCFMHSIIQDRMDLDLSATRPSISFLNGEYWGVRNLHEKMNEHFIAENNNIKPDNIDLLEYIHHNSEVQVVHGLADSFNSLIDYIGSNSLADNDHYEYVESQIDINNYIEYNVAQIYFDNSDWPGNNIKWWRKSYPAGKWRWLLFDTDFGFGLSPFGNETGDELLHYKHNTLLLATADNGDEWPNPPHSTFLFRSLLGNQVFQNRFINTFCDHLNTSFQADRVNDILDTYKALYEPEIERHRQSFSGGPGDWQTDVDVLSTFADNRVSYAYIHLMIQFGLQRGKMINLDVSDITKGDVGINSLLCSSYPWTGKYFPYVPVTVRAIPKPGFKFVEWSDGNTSLEREIDVQDITDLTAYFEISSFDPYDIMINEINYISSADFGTEDWVEFLNNSETTADISKWIFKDSDDTHIYSFPVGTFIQPKQGLVLCRDKTSFKFMQPDVKNLSGDMVFGFSSFGEVLRLYDSLNNLIDMVNYGVSSPWPDLLGMEGRTIQLVDTEKDNSLASNWRISNEIGGSPGKENTIPLNTPEFRKEVWGLSQNFPNPFSEQTHINYYVEEASNIRIVIFNLSGQIVKELVNQQHEPGSYSSNWNGINDSGDRVEAGIYFYQITTAGYQKTRKMILIK